MTTGIIYLAKNTISGKCYVGQTIRTLAQRKKEHLVTTIKTNYKFGKALQKYPKDSWEWSVLAKVDIKDLNEYEMFFINDLNSFKNGYNTLTGESWKDTGNPRKNNTIYELWHPEYGIIRESFSQLNERSLSFNHIHELIKEKRQHIAGFVLPKNKDKYDLIVKNYNFYHPNHGVVTCSATELFNNYNQYFNSKNNIVYHLTAKKVKVCCGWCLAENKDNYKDLADISKYVTLYHPEYGNEKLKISEFKNKYGLTDSGISYLISGRNKTTKGWKLISTH